MARVVPRSPGTNQHTAPLQGGLLSLRVELRGAQGLIRGLQSEIGRSGRAIRAAHEDAASTLQQMMLDELIAGMNNPSMRHGNPARETAGRSGTGGHSAGALRRAVVDRQARDVKIQGFSVGGELLDKTRAAAYWRVQEFGYDGFVDTEIAGMFVTGGGKFSFPTRDVSEHTDPRLKQFGYSGKGHPWVVRISNPIKGYHYHQQAWTKFVAEGWTSRYLMTYYGEMFSLQGLNFLSRFMQGNAGKRPSVRSIRTTSAY